MKELIRANDPVLLSWVEATMAAEGIETVILDTHMSVLEGSVNALQRRIMVDDDDYSRARRILDDARAGGLDV